MGAGFRRDVVAGLLRFLDLLGDVRAGHVADVGLAARRLRDFDDRVRRDHFRSDGSGIEEALPIEAAFPFHLRFPFFDHREIFAVEAGAAAEFFDDVHRFVNLPVVKGLVVR